MTTVQIGSARSAVAAAGGMPETKSGELDLSQITNGATAIGTLVTLAVVAVSASLIRSESASDLRTVHRGATEPIWLLGAAGQFYRHQASGWRGR